jgi:hypothetical protein
LFGVIVVNGTGVSQEKSNASDDAPHKKEQLNKDVSVKQ